MLIEYVFKHHPVVNLDNVRAPTDLEEERTQQSLVCNAGCDMLAGKYRFPRPSYQRDLLFTGCARVAWTTKR